MGRSPRPHVRVNHLSRVPVCRGESPDRPHDPDVGGRRAAQAEQVVFFFCICGEHRSSDIRSSQRKLGIMNFVALQMLIGDRAKYLGLICAVAFSTFLMSHQSSIFAGIMERTTSQIKDIKDASIWVMDPKTQYFDEVKALTDDDVYRVRGVPGVEWAVPLFKGLPRARAFDGNFRVVIMMGVDDATLVGAPRDMVLGSPEDLRKPDAVLVDRVGYEFFFPKQPYILGRTLELNDHRVTIQGIFNSSAPFQNLPIFYARYSQAMTYVGRERNLLFCVQIGRA